MSRAVPAHTSGDRGDKKPPSGSSGTQPRGHKDTTSPGTVFNSTWYSFSLYTVSVTCSGRYTFRGWTPPMWGHWREQFRRVEERRRRFVIRYFTLDSSCHSHSICNRGVILNKCASTFFNPSELLSPTPPSAASTSPPSTAAPAATLPPRRHPRRRRALRLPRSHQR